VKGEVNSFYDSAFTLSLPRRSRPTICYARFTSCRDILFCTCVPKLLRRVLDSIWGRHWFAKFWRPNPHVSSQSLLPTRIDPNNAIRCDAVRYKIVFGTNATCLCFSNARRLAGVENKVNDTLRPFLCPVSNLFEMNLFLGGRNISPLIKFVRGYNQATLGLLLGRLYERQRQTNSKNQYGLHRSVGHHS
jgi:hypothetical protein